MVSHWFLEIWREYPFHMMLIRTGDRWVAHEACIVTRLLLTAKTLRFFLSYCINDQVECRYPEWLKVIWQHSKIIIVIDEIFANPS